MKSEHISMLFFIPFISLFYIVGFGLLGYSMLSLKRSTDASAWMVVPGEIESCELETSNDSDDGDTHEVKVTYRYSVGGQKYTNNVLAFGYSASSGRAAHEQIFEKLNKAKSVDVRYDPIDPQHSVLSFGFHRSIQFMLVFSITWLLFVFGFTLIAWLASRPDNVLIENLTVR